MERKTMPHSSSNKKRRHVWAGKIEYQVAAILLDLYHLFYKPTPGIASLLSTTTWACKKRRSAIDVAGADDFVVVRDTAAPPPRRLVPAQSDERRSLDKARRKSVSTETRKKFLKKKVEELTVCRSSLKTGIDNVLAYREKLLKRNALLRAVKAEHELNKQNTAEVKNAETEIAAATVSPPRQASQQPMSLMHEARQSSQVLPVPEASYSLGYASPGTSSDGFPVSRTMDPSAWPLPSELGCSIGVDHAEKCKAPEAKGTRMIVIKCGKK